MCVYTRVVSVCVCIHVHCQPEAQVPTCAYSTGVLENIPNVGSSHAVHDVLVRAALQAALPCRDAAEPEQLPCEPGYIPGESLGAEQLPPVVPRPPPSPPRAPRPRQAHAIPRTHSSILYRKARAHPHAHKHASRHDVSTSKDRHQSKCCV